MVKYWRFAGNKIVVFLDDGWGVNSSFELTKNDADFVLDTLKKAGFIVNLDKSIFIPVQCLEWLGLIWDLENGFLKIPDRRIRSALDCLDSLLQFPLASAKKLAQVAGKIISMSPVLGNVCMLQTKAFFHLIKSRTSWDRQLDATSCIHVLEFWRRTLELPFQKTLFHDFLPAVLVYSDASAVAGAAYIRCEEAVAHRTWSDSEKKQSSTHREL